MFTQVLTFHLPVSPRPNGGNNQSVLHTHNGWTLTVKKTGTNASINTFLKTLRTSLTAAHYQAFCAAFQGNSGAKTLTVTYAAGTVRSLRWDTTTVNLQEEGAFALAAAQAAEDPDEQQPSSRA
jgi:hypothetical protein